MSEHVGFGFRSGRRQRQQGRDTPRFRSSCLLLLRFTTLLMFLFISLFASADGG